MEKVDLILNYLEGKLDDKAKVDFETRLQEDASLATEVSAIRKDWNRQRLGDWLNGDLPEAEATALSLELEADESLRNELQDLKQINEIMSIAHRNQILKDVEKIAITEERRSPVQNQRTFWIKAASILFLLGILSFYVFYLPAQFSNTTLVTKHFKLYGKGNLLSVDIDDTQKSIYKTGLDYYNQGAYEAAISTFQKIPSSSTSYNNVLFYIANSYFALNQPEKSISILSKLLFDSNDASTKSRLQWYLGCAYLKADREAKAIEQFSALALDNTDPFYQRKAQKILKEIEVVWRKLPGVK